MKENLYMQVPFVLPFLNSISLASQTTLSYIFPVPAKYKEKSGQVWLTRLNQSSAARPFCHRELISTLYITKVGIDGKGWPRRYGTFQVDIRD